MNPLHPKKLLLTKWTSVIVTAKQKHFLVSKVILPEDPTEKIQWIEIEAIYNHEKKLILWQELNDQSVWLHGWV